MITDDLISGTLPVSVIVIANLVMLGVVITLKPIPGGGGGSTTLNYTELHYTFAIFFGWCNSV